MTEIKTRENGARRREEPRGNGKSVVIIELFVELFYHDSHLSSS